MILTDTSGPREEYNLVEIRIFPSTDGGKTHPVELEVLGWRSFPPGTLRLDRIRLIESAADPLAYGRALGEMLFADDATGDAFRETLAAIEARGGALRLRLRIDPPDLASLGWERVLAPIDGNWQPLAATAATPFSRYVLAQGWERPAPVTERPLHMLAAIASPANLAEFGLDAIAADERKALHDLLDGLPDVKVTYLESGTATPPTLNAIRTALAAGYHIMHFLCHGAAIEGGTALYLEGDEGAVDVVKADRLLGAFSLVKTPPLLCFLAACETAARSRHDAFVPLGPALVEQGGASAALAMADRVGLDTARLFTGQFYTRLLSHGVADLATNEARALVQDQWDWGVPLLFCRLADSQLIDFPVGTPIARIGGMAMTMNRALEEARQQYQGEQIVAELERILSGLEASFRNLVRLGSEFRATGVPPPSFPEKYDAFYVSFKEYYDQETFDDEQALLRQMMRLKAETLPHCRPLFDDETYRKLVEELELLTESKAGLVQGLGLFLESMNTAVDGIKGLLDSGDVATAIAKKREFENSISPSLNFSKDLLRQISAGIGEVQLA
jgi:hypothetical protein